MGSPGRTRTTGPGDAVPGPADDVTIDLAGNPTIAISSGTQSVQSLTCSDPLSIAGGIADRLRELDAERRPDHDRRPARGDGRFRELDAERRPDHDRRPARGDGHRRFLHRDGNNDGLRRKLSKHWTVPDIELPDLSAYSFPNGNSSVSPRFFRPLVR